MSRAAPVISAVDWGTTRLRIWLLDAGGAVQAERRSDEGLLSAQPDKFSAILEKNLAAMGASSTLPVIVCGMAGSRQGWIEAPYIDVPASFHDILAGAVRIADARRDIRIVPGVAQRLADVPDVMRGEETQLAGAASLLGSGSHLACMPGTHSKWVSMEDGAITGFSTFMTGELFSVLSGHSILSHSLGQSAQFSAGNEHFRSWCGHALSDGDIASRLFRIRASTLLLGLQPEDAAAALSGLLIGAEIASATNRFGKSATVALIASGLMRELYGAALAMTGCRFATIDADEAVRAGLMEAARHCSMTDGAAG